MSELDSLLNTVQCMDGIELMKLLPDKSVDAFITDLPYGTTACSWDEIIPFAPMWAEVKRTLKPRGVFVTTASQPFTSKLVMSNVGMFKYSWVWMKSMATGHMHAKNKPLKRHEDIVVFSSGVTVHESQTDNRMYYYPQMSDGTPYRKTHRTHGAKYLHPASEVNLNFIGTTSVNDGERYPHSLLDFPYGNHDTEHPTQKPVALYEYLIRTYTQPNELVVDFCCGSGTTALAARNLGRRFIVGDITAEYVEVARDRLAEAYTPLFPAFL